MAVGQVRRHQALITRFRPTAPWLLLDCAVSKPSVNQCVDRAQDLPRLESLAFSREETRQAHYCAELEGLRVYLHGCIDALPKAGFRLPDIHCHTLTMDHAVVAKVPVSFRAACSPISSTTRPLTFPVLSRLKMSLIESSGRVSIVALTLPSAANVSASCRSMRVPTIEPRMVYRFRTTSKIETGNSPGGRPFSTHVPPRRSIPTACLNAIVETAVTRTPCAPPICL